MSITGDRIRLLRTRASLTQEELAQKLRDVYDTKTDRVMISKWEIGFQEPETFSIKCLSELFKVSMDYLIGKTDNEKPATENSNGLSEKDRDFLATLHKLPPEKLVLVESLVKELSNNQ